MRTVQFTQIEAVAAAGGVWYRLYALDGVGRLWTARLPIEGPDDWELVPMPERKKKLTPYEEALAAQEELRKLVASGKCPDDLSPGGKTCPACGQERKLVPPGEATAYAPRWIHVKEESDGD